MNFGIIGAGMIARFHAQAIAAMDGCNLHSVVSSRFEAAQKLASQYGAKAYSDLNEFLADEQIDIVTVATPSGAHLEASMAALNAGKHVICEKPLEISVERIDTLISAAKNQGKTLAAILNRRFHPAMKAFKKAVDGNRFGKLTSASCYVKWFRDQAYYESAAWRGTLSLDGGGALMNQSIHTIDALINLAGPVKSVQANVACLAHSGIEVEDMAVAILEFACGARGVIEGSTCSWSKKGHPARIQLCGTEGSAFLADEAIEVWDFMHEIPEDLKIRQSLMNGQSAGLGANDPTAISYAQHQRNFEEVVQAIHDGREPLTSAKEARKSVALISAIYESAANGGKRIEL
jgi:predicted dehydrogenase